MEAGIVLTVTPWTTFWERNYFAAVLPWLGEAMGNGYVRGAVTGVGLITAFVGLRDLSAAILARGAEADRAAGPSAGSPSP